MLLAAQLEAQRHLLLHMFHDRSRNADATGLSQLLQPRRHVHRIAMAVLSFNDHVADMYPDANVDAPVSGQPDVALRHLALKDRRALDSIDDAAELGQEPVPHQLENPTAVFGDLRLEQLLLVRS